MIVYTTDTGKEIVVGDDGILASKYGNPFEPKGGGKWEFYGFAPADGDPAKDRLDGFQPGCILVFRDDQLGMDGYHSRVITKIREEPAKQP